MMRNWLHAVWVAILIIGCMWGVAQWQLLQTGEVNTEEKSAEPIRAPEQKRLKLIDRDAVADHFYWTDDKGVGFEYSEVQLTELQSDPDNRNYKKVLRRFVQSELATDIESFQTISGQLNPKRIMVATTDGMLYEIAMKKRSTHRQIWTVEGYNFTSGYTTDELPQDELNEDFYPTYRVLELAHADPQVQMWANPLIQKAQGNPSTPTNGVETFYTVQNGKTYLLIKTSQSETDSVEIEGVRIWAGDMNVPYQTYVYGERADRSFINDYLLVEVPEVSEGVTFYNTLTVVR